VLRGRVTLLPGGEGGTLEEVGGRLTVKIGFRVDTGFEFEALCSWSLKQ
jgi:hypothetical protein